MPGLTQKQVIDRITLRGMRVMRGLENESIQALANAYRGAQDEIIRAVQSVMMQTSTPGQWSMAEMAATGRSTDLFQSIQSRLGVLQSQTNVRVEQAAVTHYNEARAWAGFGLDQGTPVSRPVQLPVLPESQIRALVNLPFEGAMFSQRVGLITDEMAGQIQNQLTRSMINGESMAAAAKRVEKVLGANNPLDPRSFANRASTIARTEMMRAQGLGKLSVFQDNADLIDGDPMEAWKWVTTPDERRCPWCRRREGKTPAQIRKMAQGNDPWGKSTEQPLHPHCRCDKYPMLKTFRQLGIDMPDNFSSNERGVRDPVSGKWVVQPEDTMEEWLAGQQVVATV